MWCGGVMVAAGAAAFVCARMCACVHIRGRLEV
jgi:hypothetical protein